MPGEDAKRACAAKEIARAQHSSGGPDLCVTVPWDLQKLPSKSGSPESLPIPQYPYYPIVPPSRVRPLSSAYQSPADPGCTPIKIMLKIYCRI